MAAPGKKLMRLYGRAPVFLQNLMSSFYGWKKRRAERSPEFWRIFHELDQSQWWPTDRLRDLQVRRLRDILQFAQEHVPFYRQRFAEHGLSWTDVSSLEDLRKFPLLTKDDIRAHAADLIPETAPEIEFIKQSTSGTTGSPLEVRLSWETLLSERAWVLRHRRWAGYDAKAWRGTFGGYRIVPLEQKKPPFWRYNLPWKQLHFSTFHMSEQNLPHYANALRSGRVRFLDGYPSALYVVARYLCATGETIPMKAVFTGSEPLYDEYRQAIELAFECRVFDFYSMTERVIGAGECEKHSGFHLCMEHVVAEVPPAGDHSGNVGELIGTSLVNRAMPMIRYRTGDIVQSSPAHCSCGRGLQLIGRVMTKAEDLLVCPDGRLISASNLTYPFKPIHAIRESQIIQEDPTSVVVQIVRRPDYTDADEQRLLDGLRECVGPGMNVSARYVEEIPRTASGKFRFLISRVPSELVRPSVENGR